MDFACDHVDRSLSCFFACLLEEAYWQDAGVHLRKALETLSVAGCRSVRDPQVEGRGCREMANHDQMLAKLGVAGLGPSSLVEDHEDRVHDFLVVDGA